MGKGGFAGGSLLLSGKLVNTNGIHTAELQVDKDRILLSLVSTGKDDNLCEQVKGNVD